MPGLEYHGFAAMFANKYFARKMLAFNFIWLFLVSLWIIYNSDQNNSFLNNSIKCETELIEWDDFIKHSCDTEDLWILINGKVYDMWPWGVTKHPGGRMICQGAGVDSTQIFNTIHSDYVHDFKESFCIGNIINQPES